MGVEIFTTPTAYKEWAHFQEDKEVTSVVVYGEKIIVTWKWTK